jgi:hypothetical protein
MSNSKKLTVGDSVVFTAEAVAEFGYPALEIFEISDARLTSEGYVFSLTQVQIPAATNAVHFGVAPADLRRVG